MGARVRPETAGGFMKLGIRVAALLTCLVAAGFAIHADDTPQSQSAEIQIQLGQEFLAEGRYLDALEAYQKAIILVGPDDVKAARSGIIQAALRVAEFDLARAEAEKLVAASPTSPEAVALYADALWSSGLFDEAET